MGVGSVDVDLRVDTAAFVRSVEASLAAVDSSIAVDASTAGLSAEVQSTLAALAAEVDVSIDEASRARLLADAAELSAAMPTVDLAIEATAASLAEAQAGLASAVEAIESSIGEVDIPVDVAESGLAGLRARISAIVAQVEATIPKVNIKTDVDAEAVTTAFRDLGNSPRFRTAGLVAAGAFGAAFAGAGVLGGLGVGLAADAEQVAVSLQTILGSSEAAQAQLQKLRDFAAETPFEFPELATSASRLLAVGANADSIIPIMRTLGDATSAMGTGSEGIQRAVTALGQMQQKGKVTAEEMMQLTEAGIPAWDALAAQIGTDTAGAMDLVSDGAVRATDVFAALESGAGPALERLSGGMAKQATTLTGLFSTLKDTASNALVGAIQPALPALKGVIGGITPLIGRVVEPLGSGFAALLSGFDFEGVLGPAVDLFADLAPVVFDVAKAAISVGKALLPLVGIAVKVGGPLVSAFAKLVEFLSPIAPVVATVAAGFAFLPGLVSAIGAAGGVIGILGTALGFLATPVGAIAAIAAAFALAYAKIEPFREAVQAVGRFITGTALPAVKEFASFVGDKLGAAFDAVKVGDFAEAFDNLGDIGSRIVDGLGTALSAIGSWVTGTAVPYLVAQGPVWLGAFLGWLGDVVPKLLVGLAQLQAQITIWLVGTAIPFLAGKAVELAGALVGFVGKAVSLLPGALGALLSALGGWVTGTLLPAVGTLFTDVIPFAIGWIAGAALRLPFELAKLWFKIQNWVLFDLIPGIVVWIAGAVPAFLGWVGATAAKLPGALASVAQGVAEFMTRLPGRIVGWIGDLSGLLVDVGGDVIRGLWSGIEGAVGGLLDGIGDIAGSVLDGFKSAFGIGSPSRLMADQVGRWIPPGIAAGIAGAAGVAIAAAGALSADVAAAAAVDTPAVTIPVELADPDLSALAALEANALSVPVSANLSATAPVDDTADTDGVVRVERPVQVVVDRRVLGEVVTDEFIQTRRGSR